MADLDELVRRLRELLSTMDATKRLCSMKDEYLASQIGQWQEAMREADAALSAQAQQPVALQPDPFREAVHALVHKMEACHDDPAYKRVWVINQIHAGPYSGPNYATELAAVKSRMVKLDASPPPAQMGPSDEIVRLARTGANDPALLTWSESQLVCSAVLRWKEGK